MGTHRCYRCGQPDHIGRDCPKGGAIPLQTMDNRRLPTLARVYAPTPGEAKNKNDIVTSILPFFTGKAIVLFDFGANHSFILAKYARRFHISIEPMEVGVLVATPIGKSMICRKIV
jgi:hypothetical protein